MYTRLQYKITILVRIIKRKRSFVCINALISWTTSRISKIMFVFDTEIIE